MEPCVPLRRLVTRRPAASDGIFLFLFLVNVDSRGRLQESHGDAKQRFRAERSLNTYRQSRHLTRWHKDGRVHSFVSDESGAGSRRTFLVPFLIFVGGPLRIKYIFFLHASYGDKCFPCEQFFERKASFLSVQFCGVAQFQ